MPRTISTKPDYSVRWWQRNGHLPPPRNVFGILERMIEFRFRSCPPRRTGAVVEADARRVGKVFSRLKGRVTDVITSPPYLDTTNYREDQWLRLWFLGCSPTTAYGRGDDRHYNKEMYWDFLQASWTGLAPLLAQQVRLVVRIGGRRLDKTELREGLVRSLEAGLSRGVRLADTGISSRIGNTQANAFRGAKASPIMEHDFAFTTSQCLRGGWSAANSRSCWSRAGLGCRTWWSQSATPCEDHLGVATLPGFEVLMTRYCLVDRLFTFTNAASVAAAYASQVATRDMAVYAGLWPR